MGRKTEKKPTKNHFVSCVSAEFPKWDGTKLEIPKMDWGQIGNSRNGPGPNWEFPKWTRAKLGIPEMDQGQIGNCRNGPGPNWEFPKWTRAKLGIPKMDQGQIGNSWNGPSHIFWFCPSLCKRGCLAPGGALLLYYITKVNTFMIRKILPRKCLALLTACRHLWQLHLVVIKFIQWNDTNRWR